MTKYHLVNFITCFIGAYIGTHLGFSGVVELLLCGGFAVFNLRGGLAMWKKLRGEKHAL